MDNRLILVVADNCEFYRLNMYYDFLQNLSAVHQNTKIYGERFNQPDSKFIKTYRPEKTIHDVIKEDLDGQVPDIVFLFYADFAPTDFTSLKSKVYLFLSDTVSTNMNTISAIGRHKFNCRGVFHNYLYEQEKINAVFNTANRFHFPCWASMKYDYNLYKTRKILDFFMSGDITPEYSYRQTFKNLFKDSGLNYIDRFLTTKDTKKDNDTFLKYLSSSRYCPHDGGINGRMQGKFFEAGFMKSVIISPDLGQEMKTNGFINGENCILFDRNLPTEQVKDLLRYIDDRYDWKKISENAHDFIKSRHTTEIRVRKFLEVVLN